jgi:hypothetical protein
LIDIFFVSGWDLSCGPGGAHACIYRGCGLVPSFVCVPAEADQRELHADVDVVIEAFGKNEQVKRVFWTLFVAMAGLVLARMVDQSDGASRGGDYYGDGSMR